MRILHISWEYPPRIVGGLSRHVYYLSRELANLGNEVYIVTLEFPNAAPEEHTKNLHIYRVKVELASYDFLTWCYAFNHFFEKKISAIASDIDIIHAHDWLVSPSAIATKHMLKKPLIATFHSLEIGRVGSLSNPLSIVINNLEWWLSYEARFVITTSYSMKNQLIEHFKLPESKIFVINNGINIDDFNIEVDEKEVKAMLGFSEDEKLIGFVGRMTEQKGPRYFVEAMPKILKRYSSARFVLVGDCWQLNEVKNLVSSYGLDQFVRVVGFVSDETLKKILKACDILVIPSVYEPFGIVALEAMALGTVVIASDVGGLSEIIDNEKNGIKIPPRNPDAIADSVIRLLNDRDFMEFLSTNAKEKVKKYSWREIALKTLEVYKLL